MEKMDSANHGHAHHDHSKMKEMPDLSMKNVKWGDYRPLLIVFGVALVVSLVAVLINNFSSFSTWMMMFMSLIFIFFALFKFLDLKGFREEFKQYDVVARQWADWGYVYPAIELFLGILYFSGRGGQIWVNIVALAFTLLTAYGVFDAMRKGKKGIKCACMGTTFNLPLSTVSLAENLLMAVMALILLLMAL